MECERSKSLLIQNTNGRAWDVLSGPAKVKRSEEHTSELQSQSNLVCRLLLEKKKKNISNHIFFNPNPYGRSALNTRCTIACSTLNNASSIRSLHPTPLLRASRRCRAPTMLRN